MGRLTQPTNLKEPGAKNSKALDGNPPEPRTNMVKNYP